MKAKPPQLSLAAAGGDQAGRAADFIDSTGHSATSVRRLGTSASCRIADVSRGGIRFSPREMSHGAMSRAPRATDTFRWRLAIGAVLIAGGYAAWLIIPLVVGSDLSPSVKSALTAIFGATPLLTKLIAIALLGRPTINFLTRHSFKLFRRDTGFFFFVEALAQSRAEKRGQHSGPESFSEPGAVGFGVAFPGVIWDLPILTGIRTTLRRRLPDQRDAGMDSELRKQMTPVPNLRRSQPPARRTKTDSFQRVGTRGAAR